jgi:hypothetical protein
MKTKLVVLVLLVASGRAQTGSKLVLSGSVPVLSGPIKKDGSPPNCSPSLQR